ncbi:hypothetical protein HYY75_03445 [bacterium]|nr:hypothetical protein [bacterium]
MPEFVIERGPSEAFQVVECFGKVKLEKENAESRLSVGIKNISDKILETSIKIRILYLLNEDSVKLSINGLPAVYSRKNPRFPFSLSPGQEISLQVSAKQGILYNLDSLKTQNSDDPKPGKSASSLSIEGFKKFFEKENYGCRFMIGHLVSKWGSFPVDFKNVHLEISIPRDFDGVFPLSGLWTKSERKGDVEYFFNGPEGFSGSVFLPKRDVEGFRKLRDAAAKEVFDGK